MYVRVCKCVSIGTETNCILCVRKVYFECVRWDRILCASDLVYIYIYIYIYNTQGNIYCGLCGSKIDHKVDR